jgi:hypothetical protein
MTAFSDDSGTLAHALLVGVTLLIYEDVPGKIGIRKHWK